MSLLSQMSVLNFIGSSSLYVHSCSHTFETSPPIFLKATLKVVYLASCLLGLLMISI